MITAIYAHGPDLGFGFKGKLPWGSFKEELDQFYNTLEIANPTNIIVGAGTWLYFPRTVRDRIKGGADVYVYATRWLDVPSEPGIFTISHIGASLPSFIEDEDTVVLGGAELLRVMYERMHIKQAFVTKIHTTTPVESDVYLDPLIGMLNENATRITNATGSNEDKSLSFTQELIIY